MWSCGKKMRNSGSGNNGHRRFLSFISYAFSSILFDVVAYSLSSKVSGIVSTQYNILFYFPSMGYNILRKYAMSPGYPSYNSFNTTFLLLALPVITFVAGIELQRIISRRFRNLENYSEQWKTESEN